MNCDWFHCYNVTGVNCNWFHCYYFTGVNCNWFHCYNFTGVNCNWFHCYYFTCVNCNWFHCYNVTGVNCDWFHCYNFTGVNCNWFHCYYFTGVNCNWFHCYYFTGVNCNWFHCYNFTGVNCESCAATYFRPPGRDQTALDACVSCDCQSAGTVVSPLSGIKDDCVTNTDVVTDPPMVSIAVYQRKREMFYLTTHSTHFIYGYMASDIWLRTILIMRKENCCRHIGYSYRLTARVLLYAPSHRQDNTYHGLCYTSRGALAGTRNSSMGPWRIDPTTHRTMSERSTSELRPALLFIISDSCSHRPVGQEPSSCVFDQRSNPVSEELAFLKMKLFLIPRLALIKMCWVHHLIWVRWSPMVVFTHGVMGHQIDPSWWTHWVISCSSQCSVTDITKALVHAILSVGWCI